jgi:hypothetical protein
MSTNAGKRLWKQYAALTRVERVNLILVAQEEGDRDEVLALENTCSDEERRLLNAHLLCLSCAASAVAIQLLALNVLTVKRIEDLLHGAQAAAGDQPGGDPCASPNPAPAPAGLSDADAAGPVLQTTTNWPRSTKRPPPLGLVSPAGAGR